MEVTASEAGLSDAGPWCSRGGRLRRGVQVTEWAFRQKIKVDWAVVEKLYAAGDYTFDQIAEIFAIAHHGDSQASFRQ